MCLMVSWTTVRENDGVPRDSCGVKWCQGTTYSGYIWPLVEAAHVVCVTVDRYTFSRGYSSYLHKNEQCPTNVTPNQTNFYPVCLLYLILTRTLTEESESDPFTLWHVCIFLPTRGQFMCGLALWLFLAWLPRVRMSWTSSGLDAVLLEADYSDKFKSGREERFSFTPPSMRATRFCTRLHNDKKWTCDIYIWLENHFFPTRAWKEFQHDPGCEIFSQMYIPYRFQSS